MSEERKKIVGVNLGNWLVLEKWMQPFLFEENCAEDEVWLNRKVPAKKLRPLMKKHRDTYIEETDFAKIAAHGINAVRLPVPYFVFGDRKPYSGCIEYVDQAMDYAEKYGLKVLIDQRRHHRCLQMAPESERGCLCIICVRTAGKALRASERVAWHRSA